MTENSYKLSWVLNLLYKAYYDKTDRLPDNTMNASTGTSSALSMRIQVIIYVAAAFVSGFVASENTMTTSDVLAKSTADDWRPLNTNQLMLMQIPAGEILFELNSNFAPDHVTNIKKMVTEGYFDDLAIIRSHENYVVQWGDPNQGSDKERAMGSAKPNLEAEFGVAINQLQKNKVELSWIDSRDAYTDRVGFSDGFHIAGDAEEAWLSHCYGTLGVGRGMGSDSGNGSSLYVVIGHAPRHLDKNVTLVGRVLSGMEHLTTLTRGTETLGFYAELEDTTPITSKLWGEEIPESKRNFEIMRTDTESFKNYVLSRANRTEEWFLNSVGKIELCNIAVPLRPIATK